MSIQFALRATLLVILISPTLSAQTAMSLKDAFKDSFLIGAAVNDGHFSERDTGGAAIVKAQFNSISPENALKWERVHPAPGRYEFDDADAYVAFGEKNHMVVIGHTLIWHNQTPAWVFEDEKGRPVKRKVLLKRMREHIHRVVGHYKGRIRGWDVVNEVVDDDGRLRQSPWLKIVGEDYIAKAFQFAHEADPKAELYYNDYSLENQPKRNAALELVRKLRAQGVLITGVGFQEHDRLEWPSLEDLDATITAFSRLGVKVLITELDIDVLPKVTEQETADVSLSAASRPELNPYSTSLPDSAQEQLAERYADLFRVFLKHRDVIPRVTFWGVTDRQSWLNGWPVKGRSSYPLLFDREGRPKPAFDAVIRTAMNARTAGAAKPPPASSQ